MSYDNYFRRLNFSEVSNELDNFKAKEVSALTSDISSRFDPKIENLQSAVNSLTSQSSAFETVDNLISTSSATLGSVFSTGSLLKKLTKNKIREKLSR